MPLHGDAVDRRHAVLLRAHAECAGELTPEFCALLPRLGVDATTSLYTPDVRVLALGPGIGFWGDDRRSSVIGQPLASLPGPADYLRAAQSALAGAAAGPSIHRLRVTWRDDAAAFRRLALDFPRTGVRMGVTIIDGVQHGH